jgi:hypothetical protein
MMYLNEQRFIHLETYIFEKMMLGVQHVTGNDEDYLRKIPSSGCTEIRASQRATIGLLPTYATR